VIAMNEKPERQERTQRQTILGLAAGLLIASWLAVAFWSQRNDALSQHEAALAVQATAQAEAEAQRNTAVREASMRATAQAEAAVQRTLAQALQMVATGQLVFDRIPQGLLIGTLLGVEALQRSGPLLEANQFIRRGLKLLPIEVARMTHDDNVTDVALSPDGRLVVSGSRVWETVTGREVARMTHNDNVTAVAFSPDGRYVVSGSEDNTARVWEATSGREVARMTHDDNVTAVAFSPDGQYVVSASVDGTARVWEATSGREVARMTHDRWVTAVAFSPNGQYVVSGSGDGTARVWWWRPEDLIAEACRRLPRNLTREEWQRYVGPEVPYHATCPGKP
jgi:dipeptidyl aminopeptidase/acylaminoacyl peptidase